MSVAVAPSPRRRAFRAVAVAAAVVLPAALLESVLAVASLPGPPPPAPGTSESGRGSPRAPWYETDPELLWRLVPSRTWNEPAEGLLDVHVNARGLRGRDRDAEIAASGLRVVCLGDSVTFGLGVEDAATVPAVIERALGEAYPDLHPVVLNAGVPGYSSVQGERLLARLASLRPAVIVWWFGMNDAKPCLGAPDAEIDGEVPLAEPPPGPFAGLRIAEFARDLARRAALRTPRVPEDESRAVLARLVASEKAGGPRVLCVAGPSLLAEKAEQLAAVARSVRAAGASRVAGSVDALAMHVMAASQATVVAGTARTDGGETVAVLAPGRFGREEIALTELEGRRDAVARWRDAWRATLAALPGDAIPAREVLSDLTADEALFDVCHLRPAGTRRAGEALAERIRRMLGPVAATGGGIEIPGNPSYRR